jgi:GIY-YIG catalytic domain-containing protein
MDADKVTVYVLQLEDGYYYVGKTTKPVDERYNEHVRGNGSAWTRLHKPINIFARYENCDVFDEDKVTKKMMMVCGIDYVRGGAYVQVELKTEHRDLIQYELDHARGACFTCHRIGHYVDDCSVNPKRKASVQVVICERCGYNHPTENCYATKTITGIPLPVGPKMSYLVNAVRAPIDEPPINQVAALSLKETPLEAPHTEKPPPKQELYTHMADLYSQLAEAHKKLSLQ